MNYSDKYFQIDNKKIHYLDNELKSSELIIVFPPGINDARFVSELEFDNNKRIVSISYPSRYKSSTFEQNNSIDNIALILKVFIENLISNSEVKSITLVGFSFGTAVIAKLLDIYHKKIINKIILINPGEFFNPVIRKLLIALFLPAFKLKLYAKFLKFLVTKIFPIYESKYIPDNRLNKVNEQWISTLKYKIDENLKIDKPVTMIIGSKDIIINKESLTKLHHKFSDYKELRYDGKHILNCGINSDYNKVKHMKLFA